MGVSGTVIDGIVGLAAFALMEPLTYAAHRWIMHGRRGWRWHASHHRASPDRFEKNDLFPVVFAAGVLVLLALGFNVRSADVLVPIGIGITLYGAVYALVHDGYIHRRFGRLRRRPGLDRLAEAHAVHHRFNGEPYGMLVPIIPRSVRDRVAARSGDRADDRAGEQVR